MRDPKWDEVLAPIINSPEIKALKVKIKEERSSGVILPKADETFEAFNYSKWDELKVVIIGAEPYNNEHAHGLAFSSKVNKPTEELNLIFKELHRDLFSAYSFEECFKSYNLFSWASQGILLINAALSVKQGLPASHRDFGWNYFTTEILKSLNDYPAPIVFIFMGVQAQKYMHLITHKAPDQLPITETTRHLVLKTVYPLKKNEQAFIGCSVFSQSIEFLIKNRTETQYAIQLVNADMFETMLNTIQENYKKNKYPIVQGCLPKNVSIFDRTKMLNYLKLFFPYYSFLNFTT